ncbi:MAG: hypothetical protein WBG63_06380 [Phormidesmis sp.]
MGTQVLAFKPVQIFKTKEECAVNTLWTTDKELRINPPCWESALFFLDTFTYLDSEFGIVDLVGTGMFDLSHAGTADELDLPKAIRAIRQKTAMAKSIVRWIADNKELLEDYPAELQPDTLQPVQSKP